MRFGLYLVLALALAIPFAAASTYPAVAVTYTALNADTYRLATAPGDVACAAWAGGDWQYSGAKLIKIQAGSAIFTGDILSSYVVDQVYFDPIGLTNGGSTSLNGTYYQDTNRENWKQRVFWKVPGRDCYNWDYVVAPNGGGKSILVPIAGTTETAGSISFVRHYYNLQGDYFTTIRFDDYPGTSYNFDITEVKYIADNPAYATHRFKANESETSMVYYFSGVNPNNGQFATYEPPFTTERGTKWLSLSTTQVSAQFASQIARPEFEFGPSYGVYIRTLITDTLDRTPENRQNTLAEDMWPAALSSPDTSGAITSPLRAVMENSITAKNLYRIGSEYVPFADYAVVDNQATGFVYTEKQSFWMGTTPNGVQYDAGASYKDIIVNRYSAMAYSEKFEGNDFGIPVCTSDLAISGDWTSCPAGSNSRSDSHRLKVKFMGNEWVINEMQQPTAALPYATAAINGGQVKLAKERVYGILNAGQMIDDAHFGGAFLVRLKGVASNGDAILTILTPKEVEIGEMQVSPGMTYTWTQSGTDNSVKVHVYKTHNDARMCKTCTSWAEMATYSDEITLKDNMRYNLVNSTHPNKDFKVSLLWKNRDYTGSGSSTVADSLREIVVYNVDSFAGNKYGKGSTFNFPASMPAYKVTYSGITPEIAPILGADADKRPAMINTPSTIRALATDMYRIAVLPGDTACAQAASGDRTYTAKMIEVNAAPNTVGGANDALPGNYLFDKFYYDPVGNGSPNMTAGPKVFARVPGRDCYNWNSITFGSSQSSTVNFPAAGNGQTPGRFMFMDSQYQPGLISSDYRIIMWETRTQPGAQAINDFIALPVYANGNGTSLQFIAPGAAGRLSYMDPAGNNSWNTTNVPPMFVSSRGTRFPSVGLAEIPFSIIPYVSNTTNQTNITPVCATKSVIEINCAEADRRNTGYAGNNSTDSMAASGTWVNKADGCTYRCRVQKKICPVSEITVDSACVNGQKWYDANGCLNRCVIPVKTETSTGTADTITGSRTGTGSSEGSRSNTASVGGKDDGSKGEPSPPADSIASSVAGSMVDVEGNTYAKIMNTLGVYIQKYKK